MCGSSAGNNWVAEVLKHFCGSVPAPAGSMKTHDAEPEATALRNSAHAQSTVQAPTSTLCWWEHCLSLCLHLCCIADTCRLVQALLWHKPLTTRVKHWPRPELLSTVCGPGPDSVCVCVCLLLTATVATGMYSHCSLSVAGWVCLWVTA
jgi:hypothetical protein